MTGTGPYETEGDALRDSLWHLHGRGDIRAANNDALAAELVGVERAEYDRSIIGWLASWEPSTVAVICGLIARARAAERARMAAKAASRLGTPDYEWDGTESTAYALGYEDGAADERDELGAGQ